MFKHKYKDRIGQIPTFGAISLGAFVISIISGAILAATFQPHKPLETISLILLNMPAAAIIRSIHYWSSHLALFAVILHIIDHLGKRTYYNLRTGVWIRTLFSFAVLIFIMLSGFFLRDDTESRQALNIFNSLIDSLPIIGGLLSNTLTGNGNIQLIYINHAATAVIIFLFLTFEHSKIIFPNLKVYVYILPFIFILSLAFIPTLHNYSDIIKGPWYLQGLQELLHWFSNPMWVWVVIVFPFILLIYMRYTKKVRKINYLLLLLLLAYCFISVFTFLLRGENWELSLSLKNLSLDFEPIQSLIYSQKIKENKIPLINGLHEGCMACHSDMNGLVDSHKPQSVGCRSCHLGNPLTLNKDLAHKGMTRTPGNYSIASKTCGASGCHQEIFIRSNGSLMNTMSGIVSVDRWIFGESKTINNHNIINDIGKSGADLHLRNLCAGCHLGKDKSKPEPVTELSRGGGCSACHLNYSDEAKSEINSTKNPKIHPDISLKVDNYHCFGCHSRSGRISTNYEGWHETELTIDELKKMDDYESNYRILLDGRVFKYIEDDVHHKAGLECIDCHSSYEIMGNGNNYYHKEEAVKIQCEDCHFIQEKTHISPFEKLGQNTIPPMKKLGRGDLTSSTPMKKLGRGDFVPFNTLELESQKIVKLRNLFKHGREFLQTSNGNYTIVNIYKDGDSIKFVSKNSLKQHILNPTPASCYLDNPGHDRLSCKSCHSSWAPQCISCHTEYKSNETSWDNLTDKECKGAWVENGKDFRAEPPTLGIMSKKINDKILESVETFVPGMIMTIKNPNTDENFKRLYAPAFSHTISNKGRNCTSCHWNPLALGYGRGNFALSEKNEVIFKPLYPLNKYDGLPNDAWIKFDLYNEPKSPAPFEKGSNKNIPPLQKGSNKNIPPLQKGGRGDLSSTRENTRPFNKTEQVNILRVGVCFTCHKENDNKKFNYFNKIKKIKKLNKRCILLNSNKVR
ncbi:MAG: hypothetical protein QG635_1982 [Bacteroidota bacterium]|nr:hypothetical protein [Bacteroidota bacterium]